MYKPTIVSSLLEKSWNDICAIVATPHALFEFVHGLRVPSPLQISIPSDQLDRSSGSRGTRGLSDAPHHSAKHDSVSSATDEAAVFQPRFFHQLSVATWFTLVPRQVEEPTSFFIGSPRSDAQSKPTFLEVMCQALDEDAPAGVPNAAPLHPEEAVPSTAPSCSRRVSASTRQGSKTAQAGESFPARELVVSPSLVESVNLFHVQVRSILSAQCISCTLIVLWATQARGLPVVLILHQNLGRSLNILLA